MNNTSADTDLAAKRKESAKSVPPTLASRRHFFPTTKRESGVRLDFWCAVPITTVSRLSWGASDRRGATLTVEDIPEAVGGGKQMPCCPPSKS